MARLLFLFVVVLASLLGACAPVHPPQSAPVVSEEGRAEFDRKLQQLMKEDEKNFDALSRKMDEYQDMEVLCDSIETGKEKGGIASACGAKLKAMRQELIDLSVLLRGGK